MGAPFIRPCATSCVFPLLPVHDRTAFFLPVHVNVVPFTCPLACCLFYQSICMLSLLPVYLYGASFTCPHRYLFQLLMYMLSLSPTKLSMCVSPILPVYTCGNSFISPYACCLFYLSICILSLFTSPFACCVFYLSICLLHLLPVYVRFVSFTCFLYLCNIMAERFRFIYLAFGFS